MFQAPMLSRSKPTPGRLSPPHAPDSGLRRRPTERTEAQGKFSIGCWSGDDFIVVAAQLVNIGQDGLMAIVDGAIRKGQPVWLRLDGAKPAENVQAIVLGATWLRRGRCALRLALPENCPVGFYEALVRCLWRRRPDPRPAPMGLGRQPGQSGP
jgi:hypothetical protein